MSVTLAQDICTSSLVKALIKAGYSICADGQTLCAGKVGMYIEFRVADIGIPYDIYAVRMNGRHVGVEDRDEDGWTLWLTKLELKGGL